MPEVIVFGAGPVGCTLALLLRAGGRSVLLIEPRAGAGTAPPRPIALSYASRLILERAGAWPDLPVTPIEGVHVSQRAGFGLTRMSAADAGVPALGYVIDYGRLGGALKEKILSSGIDIATHCDSGLRADAALVVHAEGSGEFATEKRYGQTALVAIVDADPPARATAYERFTAEGPLALLPLDGSYGTVWAVHPQRAEALVAMPQAQFLGEMQAVFGDRAGRLIAVRDRSSAALALRVRMSRAGAREAYIGNAAQTLHPVAGQGLNLGLRDAWELACAIDQARDAGSEYVLRRYRARRRLDALATIRVTDLLAGLFVGTSDLSRALRGAAMCALDACAPARRFLARRMIFGPSALP